ncbi:nitrate reductase [Paxillus involutus ATCC 200175]|uniref:Nitrate reductase n=1 Tax=Paxillus involutus ATCC 200175 TaxID=664439 RepID=A0A0C9UAA8_PAXIN|nr:nitrate reductase [Paxillus involutus ATCC 200175]
MEIELDSPRSGRSSVGTSSDSSADNTPPLTPLTDSIRASPEPTPLKTKVIFEGPFSPASLKDPERNGPTLPRSLPQLPLNTTPVDVAEPDRETPDNWVNRNSELVRLTGKHPFNCEARLDTLFDAGFLTPAHLHFVRNHGAVPRVTEETALAWTIQIHGLVQKEVTFTLQELSELFPVVTLPVTLVCAGNRRKEQNVVRKTLGFSWGAAGVSTALWTGVYLADILQYVNPIRGKAKYVVFEGGDSLPNGPYGTSQRLSWATNKERGMLIAWAMNGLPLEPDHGFPVRLVVPGQIGGRSVKWLKRIEISERESQHHLHFWDNKLLPTQVLPEQVRAEKHWWYDPRYIITELNVNSAIAKPNHNEKMTIDRYFPSGCEVPSYTIRGYAYAGGGRRISRVEVSLDEGQSWTLADIEYPEDRFREVCHTDPIYGTLDLTQRDTSFCWSFWSYSVSHDILGGCDAIMVRAMDESGALQPRDMYWHALGMLNNWWFRVAVTKTVSETKVELQFEHPTLAGTAAGGWMEKMKQAGEDITTPSFGLSDSKAKPNNPEPPVAEIPLTKPGVNRKITLEELKNQDRHKPWFVVNGEVYDGTAFLNEHPGGEDSILLVAGEDASEDFFTIHSAEGKARLAEFHIGTLSDTIPKEGASVEEESGEVFLNRTRWKNVKLCNIERVNHDSYLYRFALPKEEQPLGLPVGQHVFVRLKRKDTGEVVQRAYTPVSREGAVGFIDFLIKLYLPSREFPAGGKMTTGFHQLVLGDIVELKGPLGSFIWEGQGTANWRGIERKVDEIGLICGGSGITPVLQVLRSVLDDNSDTTTKLWMLNANRTEEDILCRSELDKLFAVHGPDRFKLHYILSKAPETWTSSVGRINEKLIVDHLPQPSEHGLILVCGPDAMISHAIKPGLRNVGWDINEFLVVF